MRISGLNGVKPQMTKKKFSQLQEGVVKQDNSRFITFEIDTSGKLESWNGWTDGIVREKIYDRLEIGSVALPTFSDIIVALFSAQWEL